MPLPSVEITVIQENMAVVSANPHRAAARSPTSPCAEESVRNTTSAERTRRPTATETWVASRSTCSRCCAVAWRCSCLASSQTKASKTTRPHVAADRATRRPSPLKIAARGLCIAVA